MPKLSHHLNELIDSSALPHACTAIPIPQKLPACDSLVDLTTLVDAEPTIRKISSYCKRCIEMAPQVVELSFPPEAIHIPGTSRVIADRLSRVYAPSGNGVVNETIHPVFAHATRTKCQTGTTAGTGRRNAYPPTRLMQYRQMASWGYSVLYSMGMVAASRPFLRLCRLMCGNWTSAGFSRKTK